MRIGVVAPSCTFAADLAERVTSLAAELCPQAELVFSDQCSLSQGHFAGDDLARAEAFVALANDPAINAIWFARGGYGSNRIATAVLPKLGEAARTKAYLGYSDAGFLLAGLYRNGIGRVAHGPMAADIKRNGGEAAVKRALDWLTDPATADTYAPADNTAVVNLAPPLSGTRRKLAAFNLTVFSNLLGTSLEPDLTDHILMLEDVDEYMYRLDRALFHVTSQPSVRQVAGIMLGRCDPVPGNDPDFGMGEEDVVRHWCTVSGIPYLGRADIGHDADNKVVVFG
jgi:muramoyltetrapeptide carboxypeptidase